eukprot:XP_011413734.1 PREDICTED: uncharacterized protein LOC105318368 [Crassostrea gigas]
MLLSRKLKIFSILAIVGVVFVTASFVSPGWVICKISNMKSLMGISGIQGLPQKAHLSAGLWYYTLCIQRFIGNNEEEDCHLATYPFNIESPFFWRPYDKFKGWPLHFKLETQIMSSIGLFCAVLGFTGTIVYTRTLTKSRWAGLLACISLFISGWTYIAMIVKMGISVNTHHEEFWEYTGWDIDQFYCPWGLILVGIGGVLILVSAVGHLFILSRNKTKDDIHVFHIHKGTNQEIISQHSYTTIAPPGYHATVELKVPLVGSMEKNEEAGCRSFK